MLSRKGDTALPAAPAGQSNDGGRRVSQHACCYHAMTVGHDELRNDGHRLAASCYSDPNLKNDLPPGDVDAWRRLTPGLNACTATCPEGDVLVTLPDPVERRPLSKCRAAEVSASALADMTPWSLRRQLHADCMGLVTSHRTALLAMANDWTRPKELGCSIPDLGLIELR